MPVPSFSRRPRPGARRRLAVGATAFVVGLGTSLAAAGAASGDVPGLTAVPAIHTPVNPLVTPSPVPTRAHLKGGVTGMADTPDTSWWGTNGRVMDIAVVGDRAYLGGSFDYVGPTTGYGAITDPSSGALIPGMPVINGVVRAAVPDGTGGWYVGGDFQKVGTTFQPGLVHLLANGTIASWKPIPKGQVYSLALDGTTLYVGGLFTQIAGTTVTNLAAIDTTTGLVVPGWTSPAVNAVVRAIAVSGGRVFVGGSFTTVGTAARRGLVALSASTGAVDATFTGSVVGSVNTLGVDPGATQLFAGGSFSGVTMGTTTTARGSLAAFAVSGNTLEPFAPAANGAVNALAFDGAGSLYVGGAFTTVGGQARPYLAQLTTAGVVSAFAGGVAGCHGTHGTNYQYTFYPCTPTVDALGVANGTLYATGLFSSAGGQVRHNAAAYTLSTGALTTWDPRPSNEGRAVSGTGSAVFLGGDLTSVGGLLRTGLAAIDTTTGAADPAFTANTNGAVDVLKPALTNTTLMVGGDFTTVQGQTRQRVAAISLPAGTLVSTFHPTVNDTVIDMAVYGSAVYLGGKFTTVNGVSRSHTAKITPVMGSLYSWAAQTSGPQGTLRAGGMVQGIAVSPDGTKVYVAGPFTTLNGHKIAGGIAVVAGSNAALTTHQLGGVTGCSGAGPWINRLYLSPDGKRLYGGGVCPDKIYEWDAVNLNALRTNGLFWVNQCNAGMQGRIEVNGHFYYGSHGGDTGAGGWCYQYPGGGKVSQQRFFVFRASDGVLDYYAPEFTTAMGIWSFAVVPGKGLLVGGDFDAAGTTQIVARGLAFFPGTP